MATKRAAEKLSEAMTEHVSDSGIYFNLYNCCTTPQEECTEREARDAG